ncbi:MAG: RNA-guided endonuclease InsQ/TnpB family protein [Hyphomicrobium sp.]
MHQRWTYRFYPTPEQEQILARTFGCVRYVYNWALAARTKAFKNGERMNYAESDKALTVLKRQPETAWLNEVSSVPTQQALRDLQSAFAAFFAKRSGYPVFKKKSARATAKYTKSGFRFSDGRRVYVSKLGVLRLRWDRNLPSDPSSVTIIREASGRYFASFVVDVEAQPMPRTGETIGIDFGVCRLATLSNGKSIANPKHLHKRSTRLAMLQKRLARKQKGSKRRALAKRAVARQHEKIGNCRKDSLNKLTTKLVREFDVICIEDLTLRGMAKNHGLARSLSDAGIGAAIRMLEDKAERYGRRTVRVDRWFPSSKMCSECGHVVSELPLQIREWACPVCKTVHDRDLNAARNILAVGHTVAAHGDGVRDAMPSGMEPGRQ